MKLHSLLQPLALACALALGSQVWAQSAKLDPKLPGYVPTQGVSGAIKSVGSDTMNNLMALWTEGFKKLYPSVTVEVEGKGSSTAPPALISGAANFGPMSRAMKDKELDDFEKQFGYKPVGVPTALDSLGVFVHKDNPIQGLTIQQLDAIFSKTRKSGAEKDIVTWGDLGLSGEWADKKVSLYGRNSVSGTYGYFKEHALAKGDFKDTVKEQPGSAAVVQAVASDRYAIGYSGIGYATADVRVVPLAKDAKSKFIEASSENVYNGSYPMSRFLYVYVNYRPGSQLEPIRREFLSYLLSKEGQAIVIKDGYFPLTAKMVENARSLVGLASSKAVEAGAAK